MRGKHFIGQLEGFSQRSRLFLSLNGPECNEGQFRVQKSLDLHEKPRELPNKVLCPNTKNNFPNVIIIGALVGLCPRGLHTDIKSMKKSRSPRKTIQNGLLCTARCKLHQILLKNHRILFKTHCILFKTHCLLF